MLENREEQLGGRESAYTAPAEADASTAFQFHSDLTPPLIKRRKRERTHRKWITALVCILLVFLCLALTVSILLLRYQISISREDGGFGLQITRRGSAFVSSDHLPDFQGDVGSIGVNSAPGFSDYQWNGATLKLEAPQHQDGLSWTNVYQTRCSCVASVTSADAEGNRQQGSAVIMSEDGFLITCSHIVLYAEDIQVTLQNGETYPAELIGLDIASDLAVLHIQTSDLTRAEFGQSESMNPGDEVAVLGASLTGTIGIYQGTITAFAEDYAYRGFPMDLFELYLRLGDQCSGAPVMNRFGQVIGIVSTDIEAQYQSAFSVSYAIPMHTAKSIIDQLLEYGYVPGRPSSGLTVAEIPAAYAVYYKYPSCVYVAAVKESSTAYAAGVRKGDLILSANGIKIQSVDQLYAVINGMEAGDELSLELYRDGDTATISFLLVNAARPVT